MAVSNGPAGLVAVNVPAGEHALVLAFETPGQRLGFLVLETAAAIVALQTLVWTMCHRRRRRRVAVAEDGWKTVAAEHAGALPARPLTTAGAKRKTGRN